MTYCKEKILLASGSPRRAEIMALAGLDFEAYPMDIDEENRDNADPNQYVRAVVLRKADAAAEQFPDRLVVAADTVVVAGDKGIAAHSYPLWKHQKRMEILGKPKDAADAERMLRLLSGKTHVVMTCAVVAKGEVRQSLLVRSGVTFRKLRGEEIAAYIATGEPMDKAGAYAIQGKGCAFITGIAGDYYNIVGLPICPLLTLLEKFTKEQTSDVSPLGA
ncbi:MAG: Maf family protein [Oscillospiraceae bacterium]|jgi:septum formation protein|nr:Maf family protein [Oscillospiraceae bacterium]